MNALVKKEIRLLLPSWIVALSLAVVPEWMIKSPEIVGGWDFFTLLFWMGMVVLALASFGREFTPGIFPLFMVQPEERKRLWRVKVTTLAAAMAIVLVAFCVSLGLRTHGALILSSWWDDFPLTQNVRGLSLLEISALFALTAFGGGLWTTLLLRQTIAAVWFVILPPAFVVVMTEWLSEKNSTLGEYLLFCICAALVVYSVAGYFFARWLFFRAQEVGWTGGTISFSNWRYFDAGGKSPAKEKRHRPIAALFGKELQLHSISLFCAIALLALHITAICLRPAATVHNHPIGELVSNGCCLLWLIMPLTIGGMAVAEERKLGLMESLLCLPVSRRIQFAIKFFMALVFGILLGGVAPIVLERIAASFGVTNGIFDGAGDHPLQTFWFDASAVAGMMGLTFIAFFASTLARNFLQALGLAIVTVLGCFLFISFIGIVYNHQPKVFGITPWHSVLPLVIAVPTIAATLLWLAWLNFKSIQEDRRLWRRNILGISGALIFIVVSSTAIYNRAGEVFEPAEPPHGPAIFSAANPPKLGNDYYDNMLVRLPDGRVWFDLLDYDYYGHEASPIKWWVRHLFNPLPTSAGAPRFVAGSNWLSATVRHVDFVLNNKEDISQPNNHIAGFLDTVGVQTDGTLWISAVSKNGAWTGDKMSRFGDGANWRQVVRSSRGVLLLKNDGTLWRWGKNTPSSNWNTNWPSLRTDPLHQIGTNSDWKEIGGIWWHNFARKADGSVWTVGVHDKTGEDELERATNLDQVSLPALSLSGNGEMAYVRPDGTLWMSWLITQNGHDVYSDFMQVGTETNWTDVTLNSRRMVALKADGSLWEWHYIRRWDMSQEQIALATQESPTRLGIHSDWVAVANTWADVITLAADGSLWLWPDRYQYETQTLLKLPKQPQYLGNVLGKSD